MSTSHVTTSQPTRSNADSLDVQEPNSTTAAPESADHPAPEPDDANTPPQTARRASRDEEQPTHGFWARFAHRLEARISALSTRNNFWHRICSWIWLPLAYRSGIKFAAGDESTFSAILPFRKFNKNWYNAMAGGALLGNAEVAGGMYVFKKCGTDYTVVCKHLEYTFRRPCHGPAVYRVEPRENIEEFVATGDEFNITVDMTIVQMVRKPDERERRVGHCTATFHVTPKTRHRLRKFKKQQREAAARRA
ncbi:PaaI family thioesterase [Phycisphaerales bacterium AB-hyl4]|uniref:PaaI family thioesterase n=1 Tax=Natronomicrosphaera hydrolytica TaxID=3242702 RepID=A0ABV4U5G8_9BACT